MQNLIGKRLGVGEAVETVDARVLQAKFRSKRDLYDYCDQRLQYYMPPKGKINKDFFKQVFAGKKALIAKDQIRPISVPKYDELSVTRLLPTVMADSHYQKFFPDQAGGNCRPAREYFFNVLNTVAPDYIKEILAHAAKARFVDARQAEGEDQIEVTAHWLRELQAMPFYSKTPGKTLMLLKKGSKTARAGFKRKRLEVTAKLTSPSQRDPNQAQSSARSQPTTSPMLGVTREIQHPA